MRFSCKHILTLSALIALSTTIIAAPIEDVSLTYINLSEKKLNKQGSEHLYVTVTRVDDLIDTDGSVLAERIMAVRVTFDVIENQLMCNGKPVSIGVSNIQVQAEMVANPKKLSIASEEDAVILADSFDIGLVSVEVTVALLDELKTKEGLTFRRLAVQELITEVNGLKVVQTQAGQQILDVFENGSYLKWAIDSPAANVSRKEQKNALNVVDCAGCDLSTIDNWWNEKSSVIRGFICASILGFFLAIYFIVNKLFSPTIAYEPVSCSQHSHQPPAYVEEEEEKPFVAQDKI